MGVEVAIGSAAATSKVAISNGHCMDQLIKDKSTMNLNLYFAVLFVSP